MDGPYVCVSAGKLRTNETRLPIEVIGHKLHLLFLSPATTTTFLAGCMRWRRKKRLPSTLQPIKSLKIKDPLMILLAGGEKRDRERMRKGE